MVDAFVGPIVDFLVKPVINKVKRHGAYVIQYKNKVQQLKQEKERLGEKKERIQGMVDRATNKGKVIEAEVSSWLKKVEQMEGDITNFLDQPEGEESFRCFLGCMCPNLVWRHKRGRAAEESKLDVSVLVSSGEGIEKLPVGHSESFQSELHFDSSQYYTTFQSRDSIVEEIKNALKDSGVDMIGVYGPGGAGKTTMVTEVAKEAKALGIFDEFVIAVVSKDPNTSKLQEELASQLDFKYEQTSEVGRADELRKALLNGKRKILVILDDLWQEQRLSAIGIPTSGLSDRGCKILLTSRNEEVFRHMEVHLCVGIGYLEKREAWELFEKVTRGSGVDESIAKKVSERCGGLPLAIVAVGAALKDKEEAVWQDARYRLKYCRIEYIEGWAPKDYIPLKWSYDFLKEADAKSCFLLCCLFPEDAEISIDDLARYSFALGLFKKVDMLKVARYRVQAMVNMLKRSCLLLNGANKDFVKMHDVFRDLAISITEKKQKEHEDGDDWPSQQVFKVDHHIRKWPNNDDWKHHTAISLSINDDSNPFPHGVLNCPKMHTLVLKHGRYPEEIPNDLFQGMQGTKVLVLEGKGKNLPSSVFELEHLQMLCLNNYSLIGADLSKIQNLKNHIEILSFKRSMIDKLPEKIGHLTYLRCLDLRFCRQLQVIPNGVISNLIHLEEFYATNSFDRWDAPIDDKGTSNASIAELKSLDQLTILHVHISTDSYKIMVQQCCNLLKRLINFAIFINVDCHFEVDFPNVLEIENIGSALDEFHLLMHKVEKLSLIDVQDLRYLCRRPEPQLTPSDVEPFCKLTDLDISKCHRMKYLFSPSCTKSLQQLKWLMVRDCSRMEKIIGVGDLCNEEEVIIGEAIIFSQLRQIMLSKLPQFRSFYPKMEKTTIEGNLSNLTTTAESIFNEKVSFPVLEDLNIHGLLVEDIWNKEMFQSPKGSSKVFFSQLKSVTVRQCHRLVNVFPSNMLPLLQNLETLCVNDCPCLTLLYEDLNPKFKFMDVFPKLRDLQLCRLPMLTKIWLNDENYCSNDNSVHLPLQTISITNCGSWRYAFSAFVARHLVSIEKLCVQACPGMEVIVSEAMGEGVTSNGIINFSKLKELELVDLPNLKSFYQFKFETSHLFDHQVTFPKIKDLLLSNLNSLKEIQLWDFLPTTHGYLHSLSIFRCQVSTKVSSHHQKRSFRKIDRLYLHNCWGFKHVIDLNGTISIGEEQFVDVGTLWLFDLPELVSLWSNNLHEIGGFRNLRRIDIINCSQLRSSFTHSMDRTLQHLEWLLVKSCEMMEIIIEENNINFAGKEEATHHIEFPKLRSLYLLELPNLKSFCNDERGSLSFSSLCYIKVRDCPKMKTFASGQICLPKQKMRANVGDEEVVEITDLNTFFESRNMDNIHETTIVELGDSPYLE